ncbi:MAG: peptidoglycan DD-metalloendopeptidase family protein [Novosphingobium sp.]|uniref:peptidoglycan DD-metalloendopeptidase family protein n=1 Tax=Novosphingobium sp. TaxID=1874826 RepID=UPI00391D1478
MLVAAPLLAEDDPKTATEYVVKSGETLGGIANRVEVPRILIIEANGLKAPYTVRAGQKLVIPRRRTHTVKEDETGLGIALDYGVAWSAIAAANGIDPKKPVKAGQKLVIPTITRAPPPPAVAASPAPGASPKMAPDPGPAPGAPKTLAQPPARFAWPVKGEIRRDFVARGGSKAFHDGIDIKADKGTAARAAAAGTVIYAAQGPKEYGLTVIIHHGGRWTTTYSFLDKITVKDGDKVKAGERVGLVGETGLATEPQLHFEVRRNRVALDPVKYLPKAD